MNTSQKYLFVAVVVGLLGLFYYQRQAHQNIPSADIAADDTTMAAPALPKTGTEASAPTPSDSAAIAATNPSIATTVGANSKSDGPSEMNEETRQKVYSEIKTQLSSLYTAEKAFYAEYNRYSSDLKAIGWLPDPGESDVKVGFAEGTTGEVIEGEDPEARMDSDYLQQQSIPEAAYTYSKWADGLSVKNLSGQCRNGCRASEHRFEIMAVSRTGPQGKPEVWTINDDKEIIKVTE